MQGYLAAALRTLHAALSAAHHCPGPISAPPSCGSCGAVPEGVDLLVGEEVDGAHRHGARQLEREACEMDGWMDRWMDG